MRCRSQQYGEKVYELVAGVPQRLPDRKKQKRYGVLCHRFPLIVRECGLAAAFGFLAAKGGGFGSEPESVLLQHYCEMIRLNAPRATDPDNLRATVLAAELAEYRRLTRDTLALGEWFKRYSEGVLKIDATGNEGNGDGGKERNDA